MTSRSRLSPVFLIAVFACVASLVGGSSSALRAADSESFLYTVGVYGGIGGSVDADPDPGLGESSFMIQAGLFTEVRTLVSVRAGRLTLDGDEGIEEFLKADLEYVNIAGEYRFSQGFYDFGAYLGVGYYRFSGDLRAGGDDSESDIGLVVGLTGDFDLTRHLSVVVDVSGHYAFIDPASVYTMGLVGLAVHF